MKNTKRLIICIICIISILSIPTSSFAATYLTTSSRGVPNLAYTEDNIQWYTDSTSITNYDAWQSKSGICVQNDGITKLNSSTTTRWDFNCSNTFLVGAVIGGVTLGFSHTCIDQCKVYKDGTNTWTYED